MSPHKYKEKSSCLHGRESSGTTKFNGRGRYLGLQSYEGVNLAKTGGAGITRVSRSVALLPRKRTQREYRALSPAHVAKCQLPATPRPSPAYQPLNARNLARPPTTSSTAGGTFQASSSPFPRLVSAPPARPRQFSGDALPPSPTPNPQPRAFRPYLFASLV